MPWKLAASTIARKECALNKKYPYCDRGFTLLELMVATLIMGILFSMVYSAIDSGVKIKTANDNSMHELNNLQNSFTWLEQDLMHLVDRKNRRAGGDFVDSFIAVNGSYDFRLEFTRSGQNNLATPQRSDLARVVYSLELNSKASVANRQQSYDLYRSFWRSVDSLRQEPTQKRLLIANLRQVKLKMMSKNFEQHEFWHHLVQNNNIKQNLPRAIEIAITTANEETFSRTFILRETHGF